MSKRLENMEVFRGRVGLALAQYVELDKLMAREELATGRPLNSVKETRESDTSGFALNRNKLAKAVRREAGRLVYELYVRAWMGKLKNGR